MNPWTIPSTFCFPKPNIFINPILSLINASICGPGPKNLYPLLYAYPEDVLGKSPPEVVLSYLAKLNVDSSLTKDLLLCSWSVLS